ncbi:MAG: glycine cleavage system protein GcvH [Proteobacteria bacterium]|nr:glycine cleavage system protein GcvH [Pseudomonadota bacterium]
MAGEFLETTADKFVFKVKRGFFYNREDCWVEIKENVATIGITDFAQRVAGDVVFVETLEAGNSLRQGKPMGELETIKLNQELIAPVNGVIQEVNKVLSEKPEIINEDPYGEGWIYKVKVEEIGEEIKNLLTAEAYFELMKRKIAGELDRIGGK